jgi:hypothetical protein
MILTEIKKDAICIIIIKSSWSMIKSHAEASPLLAFHEAAKAFRGWVNSFLDCPGIQTRTLCFKEKNYGK